MKMRSKKELFKQLEKMEDFRKHREQIVYPQAQILFMSLFGLLKGHTTFKELQIYLSFNKNNKIFKKIFNKTKIRIPVLSTLHRILTNVSHNQLEIVFRDYFKKYSKGKNIAVDGKWLNGSDVNGQYEKQSHKSVLNILDKDNKIEIAHKFLEKGKLSEIPAFEEILKDTFFDDGGQIFTFDALLTQVDIIDTINTAKNKYIAKVKGNQKLLLDQVRLTINNFHKPTNSYSSPLWQTENNKSVKRTVDIFENKDCDIVMYHSDFKNVQTLIRVTKEITCPTTGVIKITIQYLIANFKSDAKDFYNKILQHWAVETYHYHKDMLTKEDDHICYINPFSITLLRSFAVNLYQLYFNNNKDTKIYDTFPVTMATIKHICGHSDEFVSDIFEQ
jgi:predicted transposase YbfD/YdcC